MSFCTNCGAAVDSQAQCGSCGTFAYESNGEKLETASHQVQHPGVLDRSADDAQLGGTVRTTAALDAAKVEADAPRGKQVIRGYQTRVSQSYRSPTRNFHIDYEAQQADNNKLVWWVTRAPVLLLLGWFTYAHLVKQVDWVFVHHVDLALHEGGHIMFRWAGDTVHALGGTIGQLLFPALFTIYFAVWRRERFAAAVTLWWFGENFMYISRYLRDAPTMELPLVGGTVHDWNYLLVEWGLLSQAHEIADVVRLVGGGIMLVCMAALVWWTLRPTRSELRSTSGYQS